MRFHILLLSLLSGLVLGGCAGTSPRSDIVAVGDSVMAWNGQSAAAIPDVAARALGQPVANLSVPGAGLISGAALLGQRIEAQLGPGRYEWVIANGGANDLNRLCGCGACGATLDRLISADGRAGVWPGFVSKLRGLGARNVLIVGYYGRVDGGGGSFDACDDELAELDRRFERLARARPDVVHVTSRAAIGGRPEFYDRDRVHPSPAGSAEIGARVAAAIAAR